jgi:tetratricopeptide (TPR) repeat protein
VDLFSKATRSLSKGDYRQAYKDAKVCYRCDPSEDRRQLFQRACFARAKELVQSGFREESRAVLATLLDLGPADESYEQDLPELLAAAGLLDRLKVETSGEMTPELLFSVADQAVLHPHEVPTSQPEIREGAARIRTALKALEANEEPRAIQEVQNVARRSPFADWKLFVRGLAAYYRQDSEQMQANWDRLHPDRFAARIAASLKGLAASDSDHVAQGDSRLRKIEAAVLEVPIWSRLEQLRSHMIHDRWHRFFKELKQSRGVLEQFDSGLPERIGRVAYATLIRGGPSRGMTEMTSAMDPSSIDPHWNRAWALAWEHPECGEVDRADAFWQAYLEDIAKMQVFGREERKRAQALVWNRIGLLAMYEGALTSDPWDDEDLEDLSRAARCFRKSLQLDPTVQATYVALAGVQIRQENDAQAAQTYKRLLKHHPDHLDALLFLVRFYESRDDPFSAREFVERARRLKPTNTEISALMWRTLVASARHDAIQGKWDEARAHFDEADRLDPSQRESLGILVRRGLMELKARNLDMGEKLIQQAKDSCKEPSAALLALAIESIRYNLTKTAQKGFERQLQAALKKKVLSQTAGEVCELMAAYLATDVDYPGRHHHVASVLAYVRRCGRVKWREEDLHRVCLFLDVLIYEDRGYDRELAHLLEKLAVKGRKKFPQHALFHLLAGESELRKGPLKCDRRFAHRCFQQTLELAKQHKDSEHESLAGRAKDKISFLEEVGLDQPPRPRLPFRGGAFDGISPADLSPDSLLAMISEMCESMGVDAEDLMPEFVDEDESEPARKTRPQKRKRQRRRDAK